jgi:hypothetical protein
MQQPMRALSSDLFWTAALVYIASSLEQTVEQKRMANNDFIS